LRVQPLLPTDMHTHAITQQKKLEQTYRTVNQVGLASTLQPNGHEEYHEHKPCGRMRTVATSRKEYMSLVYASIEIVSQCNG
jgi:hypothetical protein